MTIQIYRLETRHKKALSQINNGLITPQEFLSLYPEMTYEDLAEICHCSISTVAHWFSSGVSQRDAKPSHLLWLTLAHHCLQRVEQSYRQNRKNQTIAG